MAELDQFNDETRLGDCLDHHAENHADRVAVRDAQTSLTYAELRAEVMRCTRALYSAGVRAGDRIATLAAPRAEVMVIFLAAAKLGVLWLGLNPKYTQRELHYVVSDARPKLIFGIREHEGLDYAADLLEIRRVHSSIARTVGLDGISGYDVSFADWLDEPDSADRVLAVELAVAAVNSEAAALLVYTSGSSGRPKGVQLRQRELLRRSRTQNEQFPATPYPRVMNPLPINHIGGMHFLSLFTFVGAGTITLVDKHRPADFVRAIKAGEINMLYTLPTMFQMLAEHPAFERGMLDQLQWVIYSGAAMPGSLIDILFAAKCNVGLTYGMTESCGSVTYARKDGYNRDVMMNTIGYPTPPGEVRVARTDGTVCDVGEDGEIQVRARYCMKSYFERPAETEAVFTDGWLKTGDIARVCQDGSIQFIGRMSEMFKSGGYNVYPREIELALEEHPQVVLSAVVGLPDPLFDEVGWAYVSQQPGSHLTEESLKAWCAEQLASYKIPKRFIVSNALPMLPVGKVDKVSLKKEARTTLEKEAATDKL